MTDYSPTVNSLTQQPEFRNGPEGREDVNDMVSRTTTHKERLWDAVNYPSENDLENWEWHQLRYQRQPEARGLIDNISEDTWGGGDIEITDDKTTDDEQTPFEQAISRFLDGDTTRKRPIHRLTNSDKQGTLGKYAVLVLGFNDDNRPDQPVEDDAFDGLEDLNFIFAYDQGCIEDFTTEDDFSSERFGLPVEYDIDVSGEDDDEQIETFHYSRVIHTAEGSTLTSSDNVGEYALKNIAHPLINIEKINAAAGEGYWRGAYQGLVLQPPTDENGVPMTFDDTDSEGSTETHRKITKWEQNYDRVINTTGEVSTLDSTPTNPVPFLESQYRSISMAWGIPQSILMGNETGERATDEDRSQYHELLAGRRQKFAEPIILRPLLNRLIAKGVLPDPDDGYTVEWPPLEELTEMEKADIFSTRMKALKDGTNGQPSQLVTMEEIRNKWMDGFDAERGSEVPDDLSIVDADFDQASQVDESETTGASSVMERPQDVATDGGSN